MELTFAIVSLQLWGGRKKEAGDRKREEGALAEVEATQGQIDGLLSQLATRIGLHL